MEMLTQEGCRLYDYIYITLLKWQNESNGKNMVLFRDEGRSEDGMKVCVAIKAQQRFL